MGQRAQVKIEESFKGPKTGELVFRSYGEDCDVTYQEGQRWVFYAVYHSASRAWHIHGCARSRLIEAAADDLLYLGNLPASAEKTRLSGELCCGPDNKRLSGITIRVLGERETFEAITDKNGVYEIYNLPPGKYFVEPKLPSNMEILPEPWEPVKPKDRVGKDVVLREKSCAVADFLVADRKTRAAFSVDFSHVRHLNHFRISKLTFSKRGSR